MAENKFLDASTINGEPVSMYVKGISEAAQAYYEKQAAKRPPDKKGRASCLANTKTVKTLLESALIGMPQEQAAARAGVSSSIISKAREESRKRKGKTYLKAFWRAWSMARQEMNFRAGLNVYKAIQDGNVGLSRDIQKATNPELNDKQQIEQRITRDENITINLRNMPDSELQRQYEALENKRKQLIKKQEIVELKKDDSGCYVADRTRSNDSADSSDSRGNQQAADQSTEVLSSESSSAKVSE